MIEPFGNKTDPKLIIVFSNPDSEEWANGSFLSSSKKAIIEQTLGKNIDSVYITSLVKEVQLVDAVAPEYGIRTPEQYEVNFNFESVLEEIKGFKDATVMPMGKSAISAFGIDADSYGRELEVRGLRVIPNYDPFLIDKRPRLEGNFRSNIHKAFQDKESEKDVELKILSFEEAYENLKQTLELYRQGKIEYMVFDTETTSFNAWEGDLIMYSWSTPYNRAGYAFPLVVNNGIPFSKEKFIKFLDLEDHLNQTINEKLEANDLEIDIVNPIKREIMQTLSTEQKREIKEKRKLVKQIIQSETDDLFYREKPKYELDLQVTKEQAIKFNALLRETLLEVPIVGHNLKFDLKFLHEHGIINIEDVKVKDDTWTMAFMVFNKRLNSLSLESLVNHYFGITWKNEVKDYLDLIPRLDQRHYGNVPTKVLGGYAAKDAYYNLLVYEKLKQFLPEDSNYITSIVTEASKVFAEVELKGVKVDWKAYEFLKKKYNEVVDECLTKIDQLPIVQKYKKENGNEFNVNSSDQLRPILFKKKYYDLPNLKLKKFVTETKKQGTDKEVINFFTDFIEKINVYLEKFDGAKSTKELDEILTRELKHSCAHIRRKTANAQAELSDKYDECLEFLKLYQKFKRFGGKLIPTYINPVPDKSPNDLYRPDYHLTRVATGRLSSGFHTLDQRSEITRMFTSRWRDEGGLFLAPDYSQIEVRIVAALSGEETLIKAYTEGYDIHATTASKTYGIPIDQVTHEQRQVGKCVDPNTWVYVNRNYQRIGSLFEGRDADTFYEPKQDFHVAINGVQASKIKKFYSNGKADRVLVCARRGLVACSKNHRFVLADGTLKRAGDLKKGDKFPETVRIENEGLPQTIKFNPFLTEKADYLQAKITDDLAYCLGVFLGDGCSHKTFIEICCGGKREYGDYKQELLDVFSSIGFEPKLKKLHTNNTGGSIQNIYLGSSNVTNFFKEFGVVDSQGSKNLHIPDYLMRSERCTRLNFLAGLIDTDGSVSKYGSIEFTTKSWVLAQDVMVLCQSLGIVSSLEAKFNEKYNKYYFRIRFSKGTAYQLKKYLRFEKKRNAMTEPQNKRTSQFENEVTEIIDLEPDHVVDIEIEHKDHLYLTNGLLTHNTLNFFTIYGGGPEALADKLKISVDEASKILNKFFAGYPKLKKWIELQQQNVARDGVVITAWGRHLFVPNKDTDHAMRQASNFPVQSAASDCVLYSCVNIWKVLKKKRMRSLIIGNVHDSIETDVYPGEVFYLTRIFKYICEEVVQKKHPWITCPLKISLELGASWGGAIEFELQELTPNRMVLEGKGLRKDFLSIKKVAETKYSTRIDVISSRELTAEDFSSEHFFRDSEEWTAKLTLESR